MKNRICKNPQQNVITSNAPMYKITIHLNPMGFTLARHEHLSHQQNSREKAYNSISRVRESTR